VLVDKYLDRAIELDVDALRDNDGNVVICGIMEHIEQAGIHSGDSACSLPTQTIPAETLDVIRKWTVDVATNLGVVGLINIQYAVQVSSAMSVPVAKVSSQYLLRTHKYLLTIC
jgi:carbamoyl-phosphate synthase large subunit